MVGGFEQQEAAVLRGLVSQVEDMLKARAEEAPQDELAELTGIRTGPSKGPDDPVLGRLLPDFHKIDPDTPSKETLDSAAALRSLYEPEVLDAKIGVAEVVLQTLPPGGGEVRLTYEQADAWLSALNDVRLALGTALDVTEDMPDQLPPDDPRAPHLGVPLADVGAGHPRAGSHRLRRGIGGDRRVQRDHGCARRPGGPVRTHGGRLAVRCHGGAAARGNRGRGGSAGRGSGDTRDGPTAAENLVSTVDAVCLAGGSAFGLAAADGVMRWLEERQRGLPVGAEPTRCADRARGLISDRPGGMGPSAGCRVRVRGVRGGHGRFRRPGHAGAGAGARPVR